MMHLQEKECFLQIGEFCCELRFVDADYAASARQYYENFISQKEPDITVEIEIILHKENIFIPDTLYYLKLFEDNKFNYCSGLITGNLDLANRRCFIRVMNALLSDPAVRIFEQFLYQLYYTLLEDKYHNNQPNTFLVHSCGVVKDGKGYIFTGPSGSGKSTVAQLSSEYDVLNDEVVFIGEDNGRYKMQASPFNGYFRLKKNASATLNKIFYLIQDDKNYIKDVNITDYIIPFARELVPPVPILSNEKRYPLSLMIDFATQILSEAPFFELHFLPNKDFWQCIEESENK